MIPNGYYLIIGEIPLGEDGQGTLTSLYYVENKRTYIWLVDRWVKAFNSVVALYHIHHNDTRVVKRIRQDRTEEFLERHNINPFRGD